MNATWDDEYLTVMEIAEHLKLNPQTIRNWIDQGQLPAIRIGRRVRVRRADVERLLAESATVEVVPEPPPAGLDEAREALGEALGRAQQLLGRRSAARRVELAEGLQELSAAVAAALDLLSGDSSPDE